VRKTSSATLGGVVLDLTEPWADITNDLDGNNVPWTLARPDGVGALQFSVALYQGGQVPNPTCEDLLSMIAEYAASRDLGDGFEETSLRRSIQIAAKSFRWQENYLRIWYLSDGRNFAFVTYTCGWEHRRAESQECEKILESLRFQENS
jgi:hypothetical protein